MADWSQQERIALVDLLLDLGPDAPTLLDGWHTRELAAHLYVREHRPDAAPGVLPIGAWSAYTDRVMRSVQRVHSYEDLVNRVRRPPLLWRVAGVDAAFNTFEYFIHHEDVRRANDRPPRQLPDEFEQALWKRLRRQAKMSFRRVPANVRLVPSIGEPVDVGGGGSQIEIKGRPSELLLLAYNRKEVAEVQIDGDRDLVMTTKLGI